MECPLRKRCGAACGFAKWPVWSLRTIRLEGCEDERLLMQRPAVPRDRRRHKNLEIERFQCVTSQRLLDRSPRCSANNPTQPVLRSVEWSNFPVIFEGCSCGAPHCGTRHKAEICSLRADILWTG